METVALVHRINRIKGQLDGIRKKIEEGNVDDCDKVLNQIKAVTNAMRSLAEAYVQENLKECLNQGKSVQSMEDQILSVISAGFKM